jgi:DNA (cytosine-5)-methyltransferase 1
MYISLSDLKGQDLKALSFFSGALGLDLGLEEEGIEVVLASEIDKSCQETIRINKPKLALVGDIRDYTAKELIKLAGLKSYKDVDLIVGGPPCQAFSTAGKRQAFEDERGNVFLKFLDLICEIKPRFAVIENVRGLLSAPLSHRPHIQRGGKFAALSEEECKGGALLHVIKRLRKAGFGISFNLYNSANFGSPQSRERVVILCSAIGEELPYLTPTHSELGQDGLKPWVTFKDAVSTLPKDNCDHINFPEKRLKYYRMLKEGQNWRDLPKKLQKEALGKSFYSGGGKTGFLRRLAWDRPAPTLVTNPAMPATDLAHPVEDRPLSVQEYKRIQEFPDSYIISGSLLNQYRQIGNAVPASLGRAIGRLLNSTLKGRVIKQPLSVEFSRYKNTDHISWEKAVRTELRNAKADSQLSLL